MAFQVAETKEAHVVVVVVVRFLKSGKVKTVNVRYRFGPMKITAACLRELGTFDLSIPMGCRFSKI